MNQNAQPIVADKKPVTQDSSSQEAQIRQRARAVVEAGSVEAAIRQGLLPKLVEVSLSEGLILGLLKQDVRTFLAIFGHGSTDIGEVLRIYTEEGATRTYNFRNEVEMAHVGTALKWMTGETCAVVTSIGPGALQAMAGSLVAACNNVGLYHIYGDETTHGEGFNMQQIPKHEQGLYGRLTALMGESYVLHTPEALRDALRRGALKVGHPYKKGPFFLMLPINTQPERRVFNLDALPGPVQLPVQAVGSEDSLRKATALLRRYHRIVIKAGGGARFAADELRSLAERIGATVVLSPGASGVLPDEHPQNMHVGGSKGSISGNFAMEMADLLIVIGSRAVCQSDCSGVGYPNVEAVININGDFSDVAHYNHTIALPGDIGVVISQLLAHIEQEADFDLTPKRSWLQRCAEKKQEWIEFRDGRTYSKTLHDPVWGRPVLTQPTAIRVVADFAKEVNAVKFFDAGDVQANGFQVVADDRPGDTYTDTGASYMGFASSALTALALCPPDKRRYGIAFSGDGSFMMNPQVLIDAVEHGAHGTLVVFDNRRMCAITSLQHAQYGVEFRTNDSVAVDYVQLASSVQGVAAFYGGHSEAELREALAKAHAHPGLSFIHVPVYAGENSEGGMGAYGSWNVGNWCEDVQSRYHKQSL
ncbi:thiamine pyrophosphate-binding protein [Telmatospirillum sp. J64-1]|uniref:thiamine pyrophosphate-binding protein n=1 Tax=Telmatospirillum sp. J64-1 TaxID=2502183 RepID=UPI00115D897B|nr:thiamine pyrophosphate-dependent enzyme [Telmatospirillum sp. J64-1]